MNIRSITMGQALETLAQQSRIVPTMIFRNPESAVTTGHRMGEEHFSDGMELGELPPQDDSLAEDKFDRIQQQ